MRGTSLYRSAKNDGFAPGARVGRYHIHDRIARGGMGEVWLATAHGAGGFSKKVVIKTILPNLASNPAYVQMLINEASLVARLCHPNIVQVFDLECIDGTYFIAMEYLSGRTLNQVIQRLDENGLRIPLWLALSTVAAACDGLQYAHDFADDEGRLLGLLHQDISPSNIMLTFTGNVSLLDFGVAKASAAEEQTRSGALKGKFHYMAPERIRGLPADRRSDIYSMGVVLYQLLTWKRPFHADNDAALLARVLRGNPKPPRRYAPTLSKKLEACVLRALAKNPAERYQHARDLAADLRAVLREQGELRDAGEIAGYLRRTFPDAPELRAQTAAAHRAGTAGDTDTSVVVDLNSALLDVVELEAIAIDEDLDLVEQETPRRVEKPPRRVRAAGSGTSMPVRQPPKQPARRSRAAAPAPRKAVPEPPAPLDRVEASRSERMPAERPSVFGRMPAERPSVFERMPAERPSVFERMPAERPSVYERMPAERPSVYDSALRHRAAALESDADIFAPSDRRRYDSDLFGTRRTREFGPDEAPEAEPAPVTRGDDAEDRWPWAVSLKKPST